MARYFTRGYWDGDIEAEITQPHAPIVETDATIDTGLLDHQGNPIFRSDRQPMGFDMSRPRCRVKAGSRKL